MTRLLRKNIKITALLITIPIICSGCWDRRPFEQIGFITLLGIESSKDTQMFKLTYAMPVTDPQTPSRKEILTTYSTLLRQGREDLKRKSARSPEAGKIQTVLYSRELAEKGYIYKMNEIFERDPINPTTARIAIVDGSTEELIRTANTFKDKEIPSAYISQILDRCAKSGYTPDTRLYIFDIEHFSKSIDNTVPIIKLRDNVIELTGTALFSKGKMVSSINTEQTGLMLAMAGKLNNKLYIIKVKNLPDETRADKKNGIALSFRNVKRKIKIKIKNGKPIVDISLKINAYIDEYKWDGLVDSNKMQTLNSHAKNEIEKNCRNLIEYLQSIDSDPIGICEIIRAKHNSCWRNSGNKNIYKQAKINVNVDFNIVQHGNIE